MNCEVGRRFWWLDGVVCGWSGKGDWGRWLGGLGVVQRLWVEGFGASLMFGVALWRLSCNFLYFKFLFFFFFFNVFILFSNSLRRANA